jgi:hypothetical protein
MKIVLKMLELTSVVLFKTTQTQKQEIVAIVIVLSKYCTLKIKTMTDLNISKFCKTQGLKYLAIKREIK